MIKQLLEGVIGLEDILNYYNATITYTNMPKNINGFVHYYKGIYDILIDKNLSNYRKKKTILHELAHIKLNQLCQADKDLLEFHRQDYEDEADRYIKGILNELK